MRGVGRETTTNTNPTYRPRRQPHPGLRRDEPAPSSPTPSGAAVYTGRHTHAPGLALSALRVYDTLQIAGPKPCTGRDAAARSTNVTCDLKLKALKVEIDIECQVQETCPCRDLPLFSSRLGLLNSTKGAKWAGLAGRHTLALPALCKCGALEQKCHRIISRDS